MSESGAAEPEPGSGPGRGWASGRGERIRRLPRPVRVAVAILVPAILTVAYFTLPFGLLSGKDHFLAWLLLVSLLVLLGLGMVVTTVRVMSDRPGNPGLVIMLLAWASILTFSATYWSLAVGHGQFSGLTTRLDALYFTGVTMTTVGYGDIYASGQVARAIVLVQLVYTFAFVAGAVTAVGTRVRGRLTQRLNK